MIRDDPIVGEMEGEMMRYQALVLVLLLPLVACGWNQQCTNYTSYNLGEEKIAAVGSEMVQDGCFAPREDPTGLNRSLLKKSFRAAPYWFPAYLDRELIYAGREGDVLHLSYREYYSRVTPEGAAGSYARPAFFQQVYYDLKTSDAIVFQDWLLKVLDANNQQIRFKVVIGPPHPEIPPPTIDGN
jgi:hypothetical protein